MRTLSISACVGILVVAVPLHAMAAAVSIVVKNSSGNVVVTATPSSADKAHERLLKLVKRCSERALTRDMKFEGTYEFTILSSEQPSVKLVKSSHQKENPVRECIEERVRAWSGKSDIERTKERGSGTRDMSLE